MRPRLRIKTKQQPDATWKAWNGDARLVVYAKTQMKAIGIVKLILEDRGKARPKTFMLHTEANSKKA